MMILLFVKIQLDVNAVLEFPLIATQSCVTFVAGMPDWSNILPSTNPPFIADTLLIQNREIYPVLRNVLLVKVGLAPLKATMPNDCTFSMVNMIHR